MKAPVKKSLEQICVCTRFVDSTLQRPGVQSLSSGVNGERHSFFCWFLNYQHFDYGGESAKPGIMSQMYDIIFLNKSI